MYVALYRICLIVQKNNIKLCYQIRLLKQLLITWTLQVNKKFLSVSSLQGAEQNSGYFRHSKHSTGLMGSSQLLTFLGNPRCLQSKYCRNLGISVTRTRVQTGSNNKGKM